MERHVPVHERAVRLIQSETIDLTDKQGRRWQATANALKDPMRVEQVGFFLAKMQHAGARFGIIFAKTNVTGGDLAALQHAYANRFLAEYNLKEDVVCLVIDYEDVYALGEGGTFRGLIDRKYEESRFGT